MPPKSRAETESDDEYGTYDLVLLQQQQENFKSFVRVIMDSINSRTEAIKSELYKI